MATRCKFRGRRGILCDVLKNWRKPRTKHRFWCCQFRVLRKTLRKTSILKLQSVKNLRKSRTKCSFWCFHLSRLASLVLCWLRRVYGGSCKTCLFGMFQSVKIGGRLARNARFGAPTCLVSSLWFSCGFAVSMGEAAKPLLFECVQAGCHVVLRGQAWYFPHSTFHIPHFTLITVRTSKNGGSLRTKLRTLSTADSHCALYARHSTGFHSSASTRYTPWGTAPHPTPHTSHFTNVHSTLHTLAGGTLWHSTTCLTQRVQNVHFTLHSFFPCTPHYTRPRVHTGFTLWRRTYLWATASHSTHLHSTIYTPHFTLCTLHSSLLSWHSTLYIPHSTLYTPPSTLYTPTLHIPHFTLHTPHSTLCTLHTPHSHTPHFTLLTLHSTLHTPHFALYTPHSTLYTPHSTLYTPHSTLYTPYSTLYTLHSTLHTLHFTLLTPHSTLHTPHSTLHTLHFTLHTPHSTLYTPHSTLYTLYTPHSTLYTPHSLLHTPYFTLLTSHSTLYTFHSTLQTGNKESMYKTVQINYCRKVLCVHCITMCFDICTINIRVSIRVSWASSCFFCYMIIWYFIHIHI